MATRSIKPKRDDTILTDWQSIPEAAPSATRSEGTIGAQVMLFVGFFLLLVGGLAMIAPLTSWGYFLRPGPGYACFTIGLCLTLYHCFVDPEPQFRLLYSLAGFVLIGIAAVLRVFPSDSGLGAYFLPLGVPALVIALLFLIGVARNESNAARRNLIRMAILGVAGVLLVFGIGRGFFDADFLTTEGAVVSVLGLAYMTSFLGLSHERDGDLGYYASLTLGILGVGVLGLATIRSFANSDFFLPAGLILIGIGLAAMTLGIGNASDRPTIVLARRELLSYFCSPVAYLVIVGLLVIFGVNFRFYQQIAMDEMQREFFLEPIVQSYCVNLFPVLAFWITIPVITMRLLSEERRSGSLELLLTAPLSEWSIVLGKFLAAWIFFLITWLPFFLFMVSFRIFGDQPFDYRPLLAFFLALACTGAGFIAIGLFISSLTGNQIIAAVLTYAVLLLALGLHFLRGSPAFEGMQDLIMYFSFLHLWSETSQGNVSVRYFAAHLSVAVFFLFLTTLALSARKWK